MRVLAVGNFYPPHDQGGGYEAVWHSAVEHLRARGHEVRVLASTFRDPDGPADEHQVFREMPWYWRDHEFPALGARTCLAIERDSGTVLARHLQDFAPDVLAWWSLGGMPMSLLERGRAAGVPAVAFVHDDWLGYGRRTDAWHRRCREGRIPSRLAGRLAGVPAHVDFARAARYVFVSETTRTRALATGLELPNSTVAHAGIADSFLDPAPERTWEGRLLYVGRIDERKGIETVVRALAELSDATLDIAGGGPTDEIERVARQWGVWERTRPLGHRDKSELFEIYEACDAVVFPVIWEEPWGLVPIEAMGRGRPVIATGRGGSNEYLRDGENCLLFGAGDSAALAAAVNRLAASAQLRARVRAGGAATALRHTEAQFNEAVERELKAAASPTPGSVGSANEIR